MRKPVEEVLAEYRINIYDTRGFNHIILCPFHADKNPSLEIRWDNGGFKCWSCGAHGNLVDFVQKFENISEDEARKKVYGEGVNIIFQPFSYKEKDETDDYMYRRYYKMIEIIELLLFKDVWFFSEDIERNKNFFIFQPEILKIPEVDIIINRQFGFKDDTFIWNRKLVDRQVIFQTAQEEMFYYECGKGRGYSEIYLAFIKFVDYYKILEKELEITLNLLNNKIFIIMHNEFMRYIRKLRFDKQIKEIKDWILGQPEKEQPELLTLLKSNLNI